MTTNDNASLPTSPMEPIRLDNLLINFTSEFNRIWNTNGSRAKTAAFWRPAPAPDQLPGYFPLGDVVVSGGANINGEIVTAVVRESDSQGVDNPRGKALSPPTDFEQVWKDTGSAAATRTSIWRPVPPTGYVAMGLVCSNDHGKPSVNAVRCVRADLVVAADVGDGIWDDKGSGATLKFSAWNIAPRPAAPGEIHFVPGTFIGVAGYNRPATQFAAYALRMQIPLQISSPAQAPTLEEHLNPGADGEAKLTHVARLPWFAVRDYVHPNEGFQRSRYYELKRTDQYVLVGYARNTTQKPVSIKWTAPRAQNSAAMKLFTRSTAIEIATAWPISALSDVRATKFSACLHSNFTHTETSSSEWGESGTQVVVAMAGKLKSVAAYQMDSYYELVREDGTEVAITFGYTDASSFYLSEYPQEPDEAAVSVPLSATSAPMEIGSAEQTSDVGVIPLPAPEMSVVIDSVP